MELTEKLRQTFLLVVSILALVCFFSSFMLFSCAVYIKIKVDARMKLIETYNSNVLPAIFLFVGVVNLAQNVTCIFVCLKMRNIENREGLMRMQLPVLIGGIVLVIFEVSTAIASFVHISILDDEFAIGLKKAMAEYIIGKEMKVELDTVQADYGCCGDLDYTNWFEYSWLDPQFLKASTRGAKKYFSTDGKYYSDDTPYSCCDYHSPRPCIHHHIYDNSKHHDYNYEVETTLYVRGCRIVLMEVYSRVLCIVAVIALLIATVKTSALLLFRLLQTSFLAAQEAGDWEATTPAYIYYLKPPDADLEEKKQLEGASDTDASANATGSGTDENTNNDTEYDDDDDEDDDNASAANHSNINYSSQIHTGDVNDIRHKPIWQPLSFAPGSPGNGYFQDSNVRHLLHADDLALPNAWGQPSWEFQTEGFVEESPSNSFKPGHAGNEISDVCDELKYTGLPVSDTGPYKRWTERNMFGSDQRVFPTQGLSEVGNGGLGPESGNASFPSDKCLMSTEAPGKQVTVEPPKSYDHQGFAGKLLARLTGALNSDKKYKDSSNSYKYSRVRTHSDSDEQEEEEDGEDAEEEEEEDEEESEEEKDICSSEEEYKTHSDKDTENKQSASGNRGTPEEHESTGNSVIDNNLKTKDTQNHVSYHVQSRTNETSAHGNERYPRADNVIYSQNYYQRRLVDTRSGSDVPKAGGRDAASSSSRASLSSYHEVDEKSEEYRVKPQKHRNYGQRLKLETDSSSASKNSLETTEDSSSAEQITMSKSVSFPRPLVAASDANATHSQIRNRLHPSISNSRLEHRSQEQKMPHHLGHASSAEWTNHHKNIRATNYLDQTDIQTGAADHTRHSVHWPTHNRLAELAGTHASSETEYEAASNGSADDNTSHRRRFIGRYTPYPHDNISHVTINSQGYTPTNIRQSRNPFSCNTLQNLPTEISYIAELSNTDIPESDSEISHLIPAAATFKRYDHLKRGQQQDESRQMHYTQAFRKHDFQFLEPQPQLTDGKKDRPTIVPHSSRRLSTTYCGQGRDEHANIPRVGNDHSDPKIEAPLEFKPAAKPFSFPLMQPSPSSFEMSSSVRNHIRSYQRRSVFLASPLTHSRSNSPMSSSPQLALFSSPLLDSPMETSTPILCTKRVWDSYKCQTLSTAAHDHSTIQPSQETSRSDPVPTFDNSNYVTVNNANQRQASLPDLFPAMPGIDQQCLGAPQQLVAVESTLLIDEVYTSTGVCDVVHNMTTTEQSTRKDRVLISPFN